MYMHYLLLLLLGICSLNICSNYHFLLLYSVFNSFTDIKNPPVVEESEFGKYSIDKIEEEEIAKKYFSQIFAPLYNQDFIELYSMLDEAYIKSENITISNLEDRLRNSGMVGTNLILEKYNVESRDDYRYYKLQISNEDHTKTEHIIIKEISPNDFTVLLGNKIIYDEKKEKIVKDGLEYEIVSIEETSYQMVVKINIKNILTDDIILNKDKENHPVKAISDRKSLISPMSDTLSKKSIHLQPGKTFTLVGVFMKNSKEKIIQLQIDNIYNSKTGNEMTSIYDLDI